jgi:hypothetical protein
MKERRAEVRMLCADVIEVSWRDGPCGHSATALLEDISASGACLQLENPAPLGAQISWTTSGHEFSGVVRYCVYREIGYFVGVEFAANSKWSKEEFEPQHLLDLKKLVS